MADPWSAALGAAAGPISLEFDPRYAGNIERLSSLLYVMLILPSSITK